MNELLEFLIKHGYAVLFGWVLAEQAGLPIPAIPVLLAMGALIGRGHYGWTPALAGSVVACLIADFAWFLIGRSKGRGVLKLLCRISLEPDSCVKTTELGFQRYGWSTLLMAKWLPGLSTAAPPLAGMTRMPIGQFLLADAAGSLLWAGGTMAVGALFHKQLETVANVAGQFGSGFLSVFLVAVGGYICWKYWQRRRVIEKFAIGRVSVEELNGMLDHPGEVFLIDMRDEREIRLTASIPGALRIGFGELDARHEEIPRDRDIILYCS